MKNRLTDFAITQILVLAFLSSTPFITVADVTFLGDASLNNSNNLEVGRSGAGTLNINSGSAVSSYRGILGKFEYSNGTATVNDAGSSWGNRSDLFVGLDGTGTLNINNGGAVSSYTGKLGYTSNSSGTVTVDGMGSSWINSSRVDVGGAGTGTLNITNGGAVSNSESAIALFSRSTGTVTVNGAGSKWINSSVLDVGLDGTGTLNISNGGTVSSAAGILGATAGSTGTATVDGASSSWVNSSNLEVGKRGTATLNISNGGLVDVTNDLLIGGAGAVNLNGGTINASSVLNIGTLTGSGTINAGVFNNDGIVGPGNSPGTLTVGGYTQDINGILNIELGGVLAGTEYDVLAVTGTANLGGTLNVDFFDLGIGLFDASLGDTFEILLAENINGEFDILTLAVLGEGLDWQLNYLIDFQGTTDIVQLSVVSAVPLPTAVWLFSSGLFGLIGIARRKKS